MKIRRMTEVLTGQPTMEGAGVRLHRFFADPRFDPFLLLDNFGSSDPRDYIKGFPWHPHRGIETITYMLEGRVAHGDSLGNKGVIGPGDVQWMTAGSGIIHEEMPQKYNGTSRGFQLWVNLPASRKMMDPRYRDVGGKTIPVGKPADGVRVKIISGRMGDTLGPVKDIVVPIEYFDVTLNADAEFEHATPSDYTAFVVMVEGKCLFGSGKGDELDAGQMGLMSSGAAVMAKADRQAARFLLLVGKPLGEPVAWRGPIVMNTEEELDLAFQEYEAGTFVKKGGV